MIVLTIAALALLLGLKIGRKDSNTDVVEQLTPSDTLTIKRVYNLIILDESGSMKKGGPSHISEQIRMLH